MEEAAARHENIFYHPAVSSDVLLGYTASADYGLLFYENSCLNHYYCSPNKIYEYIMAGLPIVVSNLFEMGRLVREYDIGIVAADDSPQGIAAAVEEIHKRGRKSFQRQVERFKKVYNWENQEKTLLDVYSR